MRAVLALVALSLTASTVAAQSRPAPDSLAAAYADIIISPVAHGTLHLVHGPTVILVDPTLRPGWDGAPVGSLLNYDGLAAPSMILVTDIHGDHFDAEAIEKLKASDYKVAFPDIAGWQWPKGLNYAAFANGKSWRVGPTTYEVVPMYNLQRGPTPTTKFHDKGRGNGYVITLGGRRIYISGDTECTPEMKALKNIDVAFIAMNLPYTATPQEAAECAKAFKPKVVYPYHYKGQDPKLFEAALVGSGIEVRLRDWYSGVKPAT